MANSTLIDKEDTMIVTFVLAWVGGLGGGAVARSATQPGW